MWKIDCDISSYVEYGMLSLPALPIRLIEVGEIIIVQNYIKVMDQASRRENRRKMSPRPSHPCCQVGLRRGARSGCAAGLKNFITTTHCDTLQPTTKHSFTYISCFQPRSCQSCQRLLCGCCVRRHSSLFYLYCTQTQSLREAQSGSLQIPAEFRRPLRSQRCKC